MDPNDKNHKVKCEFWAVQRQGAYSLNNLLQLSLKGIGNIKKEIFRNAILLSIT